jgi:hypothetical protein
MNPCSPTAEITFNLIAAAIGGGFVLMYRAIKVRLPLHKLSPARRKVLKGTWTGIAKPLIPSSGIPAEIPVEYTFDVGLLGRRITATSYYYSLEDPNERIADKHTGGFYQENYLMLRFRKSEEHIQGFGTVILELDGKAKYLKGYAFGWGSEVNGLYVAEVILKRVVSHLAPITVLQTPATITQAKQQ